MATVTGFTSSRMLDIEANTVTSGNVDAGGHLILSKHNGSTLDAGKVSGEPGAPGNPGPPTSEFVVNAQTQLMLRIQQALTGGGFRVATSEGVGWSERFIAMGIGRTSQATDGYFQITQPPSSQLIPIVGGSSSYTSAGSVIPMRVWQSLYYDVPINGSGVSDPSRFYLVDYTNPTVTIPATWVLIVSRTGDAHRPTYLWADGVAQDYWRPMSLQSSWVPLGGGWKPPAWRFTSEGYIELRGQLKDGPTGQANPFYTFPADYGPDNDSGTNTAGEMFMQSAFNGSARIDVLGNGKCLCATYYAGGSNGYLSLSGIRWRPKNT